MSRLDVFPRQLLRFYLDQLGKYQRLRYKDERHYATFSHANVLKEKWTT
jgi:hypothetical protein